MMEEDFYNTLPVFSDFNDLDQQAHYQGVPDNWWIVITNVENATEAIYEGRYKDVNTVGVATITAVKHAMSGQDFPYSFSGNGARMVIPPKELESVKNELCAVRGLAKTKFELELKVGLVPCTDVFALGANLQVAKYALASDNCMTLFKGQGLEEAERRISTDDRYELEDRSKAKTDLKQLSCRWQAIPNKNGQMLCLLLQARDRSDMETYTHFLEEFQQIIPEGAKHQPVDYKQMQYKGPWKNAVDEVRFGEGWWFTARRGVTVFMQTLLFTIPFVRNRMFKRYLEDLNVNTDYRKFDDMLRMVVDCTQDQIKAIEKLCQRYYKEHKAYYGIHLSEKALMTCFVEDLFKGKHMHFIDGDKGGYAMAAVPLHQQIAAH